MEKWLEALRGKGWGVHRGLWVLWPVFPKGEIEGLLSTEDFSHVPIFLLKACLFASGFFWFYFNNLR